MIQNWKCPYRAFFSIAAKNPHRRRQSAHDNFWRPVSAQPEVFHHGWCRSGGDKLTLSLNLLYDLGHVLVIYPDHVVIDRSPPASAGAFGSGEKYPGFWDTVLHFMGFIGIPRQLDSPGNPRTQGERVSPRMQSIV